MKTITPALFLAAVTTVAFPAAAAADADAVTVEVDVTDTAKKDAHTVTFTLGIAREGDCAEASSDDGSLGYKLVICRNRGDAKEPVLSFDIERKRRGKGADVTRRVRVSSQLAPGKRTIVGKMAGGEDAIEIAATVR